MTRNRPAPPPTQRSFANRWGELDYLCNKIRYWLYTRNAQSKAEAFADRLEQVLSALPDDDRAILRQEGLALLSALKGDLARSMQYRRREIQLMERLQREAQSPRYSESTRAYMLMGRGPEALTERRAIVASLAKAIARQNADVTRSARSG